MAQHLGVPFDKIRLVQGDSDEIAVGGGSGGSRSMQVAAQAFGEASALAARNFGSGGQHFARLDELVEALKAEMQPETTVLVKGSRFMRMERIVEAVVTDAGSAGGQK